MTDKDLLEEDPQSKKPALKMIIAQIENTRVGLIREILGLNKEVAQLNTRLDNAERSVTQRNNYLDMLIKLQLGINFAVIICLLCSVAQKYFLEDNLSYILDKLTKLGL